MNRLFQKNYAKLQQKTQVYLKDLYHEVIHYMHQPSSIHFRYVLCLGQLYVLAFMMISYQEYYAQTFKRKRMRLNRLENTLTEPLQRREHELLNEGARNHHTR